MDIEELKVELEKFAVERDWNQFHSPKNLSMALSVEVSELLEHFQWMTEEESVNPSAKVLKMVAEEIADVQIYLVRLADKLGVDIDSAVKAKLAGNRIKYPAEIVKGSSAKYTDYQ